MKKRSYLEATKEARQTYRKEVKGSVFYWIGFVLMIIGIIILFTGVLIPFGIGLIILGILIKIIVKWKSLRKKVY